MRERSHMGTARRVDAAHPLAPLHLEPRRRRLRYEVVGLGLLVCGLLLLLADNHGGLVGPFLHHALAFLIGTVGATAIGVALISLGIVMVLRWEPIEFHRLAVGFGLLLWIALAIWEVRLPPAGFVARDFASEPGGLLGVLIAESLRPLVGQTISQLILLLAALCTIGYISDTPLIHLFAGAARGSIRLVYLTVQSLAKVRLRRSPPPAPLKVTKKARRSPAPPSQPEPEADAPAPKELVQPRLQLLDSNEEPSEPPEQEPAEGYEDYELPPLTLLAEPQSDEQSQKEALASAEILERALANYGIEARVVDIERGPRVTRYEIHLPPGVRVSRVTNLSDDLAYALSALAVRVEAPVPGKGVIGIEVPNPEVTFVNLREILESKAAERIKSKIAFALGRDISGHPMMTDLATMPHLLIAGTTNSGKSVCLNSMIASVLFRARPDEVKLLLIDPKRVELSLYEGIPHLAAPVAHDAKESAGLLRWAIREMELRYSQFADLGVRNIAGWNERAKIDQELEPLYYLVIVIDELADLMMQAATEFETSICRLAQLARATGIHLVVATQRPSVNVITGTIKANIASRIAFAVASQVDSRTILDINGAERLVGSGDMLYLPLDAPTGKPVRIQGAYISERDISAVVTFLKQQAKPHYSSAALESVGHVVIAGKEDADDPMFETALEYVLATKHASASMLQRKFKLGYTRAARLIDIMEERGYVGPNDGRKPREVYSGPQHHIPRASSMIENAPDDPEFEDDEPEETEGFGEDE